MKITYQKSFRKKIALLMAAALLCSTDISASAGSRTAGDVNVLDTSKAATEAAVTENSSPPQISTPSAVTEVPEVSSSPQISTPSAVTEVPEVSSSSQISTPPAVTDLPDVSSVPQISTPPAVTETPAASVPPQIEDLTPSPLKGITLCSLGKNKVRLRWQKSEPVLYYLVYRKKAGESKYRLLSRATKTCYVDKGISWQQTYRYKVVPVMEADGNEWKGKGASILFENCKAVATDHQKYTFEEMQSDIKMLAKNYSEWVDYKVIGKSADGREIYDVILGNPDAKKSMLVVAAIHAREYMTSLLIMNQIEYYLQNYQKNIDGARVKNTLDTICIHYIPMANPDGVTISQSGTRNIRSSALRRRIRRMAHGSTKYWKANARGVDLNRNFPYLFKTSGKRGSMGYTGPKGGSESETRAIVKLVKQLKQKKKLKGVVNYHAMGSIVFGDSRKGGSLRRVTYKMYRSARKTTGYRSAAGYRGSTSLGRGCLREYVMYGQKIPSITLEVGHIACPGPIWEFASIWRKNRKVVLQQARLLS